MATDAGLQTDTGARNERKRCATAYVVRNLLGSIGDLDVSAHNYMGKNVLLLVVDYEYNQITHSKFHSCMCG